MDLITPPDITTWVVRGRCRRGPAHFLPSGHAHPTTCLDCGAALTDRYCAHCGQPANTHRDRPLKHLLLHDLPPLHLARYDKRPGVHFLADADAPRRSPSEG